MDNWSHGSEHRIFFRWCAIKRFFLIALNNALLTSWIMVPIVYFGSIKIIGPEFLVGALVIFSFMFAGKYWEIFDRDEDSRQRVRLDNDGLVKSILMKIPPFTICYLARGMYRTFILMTRPRRN